MEGEPGQWGESNHAKVAGPHDRTEIAMRDGDDRTKVRGNLIF